MRCPVVLSHVSALWVHRLSAAGILSTPYGLGAVSLADAARSVPTASELMQGCLSFSTADLAALNIYVRADIERYLQEHRPDDPYEAFAYAQMAPHMVSIPLPLDCLCPSVGRRQHRADMRFHVASGELPAEPILVVQDDLCVTSPELTIFQMGRILKEVHLMAALITELAGSYVLLPPGLISCDRYLREGRSPFRGGRLLGDGYVDCQPVTAMENLQAILDECPHFEGSQLVRKALTGSGNGSASPFETYVDVELQLKRLYGGAGAGRGKLNEKVYFSEGARKLSGGRAYAIADLLYTKRNGKRIDVEPRGVFGHAGREEMDSDTHRRQALEYMDVEVVDITWRQYTNHETWAAICRRITNHLGKHYHHPTDEIKRLQMRVHDDFCSWNCLRTFPPASWRSPR